MVIQLIDKKLFIDVESAKNNKYLKDEIGHYENSIEEDKAAI